MVQLRKNIYVSIRAVKSTELMCDSFFDAVGYGIYKETQFQNLGAINLQFTVPMATAYGRPFWQ